MRLLPRSAWTDTAPGFSRALSASQVTGIVIHYPGDAAVTRKGLSQTRNGALLRGYRRYHLTGRGWPDIGYCYAVDQAGTCWTLAGNRVAAHSATEADPTANHTNIGVLFIVGNNEAPTPEAVQAFRELRAHLLKTFPRATRLRGHRQVTGASTSCPGNALINLINSGALTSSPPAPAPTPKEDDDMAKVTDQQLEDLLSGASAARQLANYLTNPIGPIGGKTYPALPLHIDQAVRNAGAAAVNAHRATGVDSRVVAREVADLIRPDLVAAIDEAAPGADVDAVLDALHKRLEN